jgi:hypothetical protein
VNIVSELEVEHKLAIQYYNDFIKYNTNPTKTKRNHVKSKLSKSFVVLLNIYKKNINSIADLVRLHQNNPLCVPDHRDTNLQDLMDLKDVTSALVEALKDQREEIFKNLS